MRRPPPILIAALVGGVAMVALAAPVGRALAGLAEARVQRDDTAVLATTKPAPPLPSGQTIAAGSQVRASDLLATRLRAMAQRGGVLVEEAAPVAGDGLARVRLRVSGSHDGVVAFADALERGIPVARFATWTLVGESAAVRLSAEVVAPWR